MQWDKTHYLCGICAKDTWTESGGNIKLRDILQNNWPVILYQGHKTQRKTRELVQTEGD